MKLTFAAVRMMVTEFKNITKALTEAARAAFTGVQEQNPAETFFAFVLSTMDDADVVEAGVNSLENHRELVKKHKLTVPSPEEEYYRWNPCEWGRFEYIGDAHFEKVTQLLKEKYDRLHEKQFHKYRKGVLDSMIKALAALDAEGFWGRGKKRETVSLFITIYDSESAEKIEERSAKKLNSRVNYQRFRNRYAETEKQELQEQERKQAAREALSALPVEQQTQQWITELLQWIEQPPEDEFEARTLLMENLQRIGKPAIMPMLDLVEQLMEHPDNNRSGTVCFDILDGIAESGASDGRTHHRLAQLLVSYCMHNHGKQRWQVTPFHLARCLSILFDGYPRPEMAGNNALVDYEKFLEAAERYLNK